MVVDFAILGTLSSAKVMVDPTRQIAVGGGGRAGGDFSIIGILCSAKVMVLRRRFVADSVSADLA